MSGSCFRDSCFRGGCFNANHRLSSRPLIQLSGGYDRGHGGLIGGIVDAFELGALRKRIHPETMHPLQLETGKALGIAVPLCLIELTLQVDPAGILVLVRGLSHGIRRVCG